MKGVMRNVKISLVLLFMILMLASCKQKIGLEEILTSSECYAPCWMDIEPGKTAKEEVLNILINLPDLVNAESIFTRVYAGKEQIGWNFVNSDVTGQIEFKDEIVSSILIGYEFGKNKRSNLQLGRIIEMYGFPTDIYFSTGIGDLSVNEVYLVNSEKGIEYQFIKPEIKKLIFSQDQKIIWILLFTPNDSSEVVLPKLDTVIDNLENHHFDWTGYTEINIPER